MMHGVTNVKDSQCTLRTGCHTRYRTRHFFNNSNTNEDIATKFEQERVRCVRNEEECFCSVSVVCVCSVCSRCNILIKGKIIKEMPVSVASATALYNVALRSVSTAAVAVRKAMNITEHVCVCFFVALGIRHTMRIRHSAICGPQRSTKFFPTFYHKRRDSPLPPPPPKKKVTEHKMCVLSFSTAFV